MTHAAQRTTSRRRAAGSRRNRRYRYVGVQFRDYGWSMITGQFDWGMAPNHQARAVDITECFPVLEAKHGA